MNDRDFDDRATSSGHRKNVYNIKSVSTRYRDQITTLTPGNNINAML